MSHVIEFLTVNVAVESLEDSVALYRSLGLHDIDAVEFPDPPIQMTDVTVQIPGGGAISLIEPRDGGGPVARFLQRRGPGVYSVALRVDDIEATMRDWIEAGFAWVSPEPVIVPGGRAARYVADQALINWLQPKSLNGVLLEVFELRGNVREYETAEAPSAAH